jgi:drug/metabolite transporter (DMT)-like permease
MLLPPSSITPVLLLTSLSLFWATLIAAYVLGEPITMTKVAGLLLALSALVLQIPAWKTHEIAHRS